ICFNVCWEEVGLAMAQWWPSARQLPVVAPPERSEAAGGSSASGSFFRGLLPSGAQPGESAGTGAAESSSWRFWRQAPTAPAGVTQESRSSFNFGLNVAALGIAQADAEESLASDALCPSLTLRQRLIGWGCCLVVGALLEFCSFGRAFHALVGGHAAATRFAVLYSLGNLTALAGTLFLAGPSRQCRRMGKQRRWVASLSFLVSLALSLLVALACGDFHGRTLVLLALVFVQWLALVWYTLSYIPFGRRMTLEALRRCWSHAFGE
ncbi:unnamed protein product, partial [Polarella glacialis]